MRMKIELKVCRDYQCGVCGKVREGDAQRMEFDNVEQIERFLCTRPKPHYMPVGWGNHFKDGTWEEQFVCEDHER